MPTFFTTLNEFWIKWNKDSALYQPLRMSSDKLEQRSTSSSWARDKIPPGNRAVFANITAKSRREVGQWSKMPCSFSIIFNLSSLIQLSLLAVYLWLLARVLIKLIQMGFDWCLKMLWWDGTFEPSIVTFLLISNDEVNAWKPWSYPYCSIVFFASGTLCNIIEETYLL